MRSVSLIMALDWKSLTNLKTFVCDSSDVAVSVKEINMRTEVPIHARCARDLREICTVYCGIWNPTLVLNSEAVEVNKTYKLAC